MNRHRCCNGEVFYQLSCCLINSPQSLFNDTVIMCLVYRELNSTSEQGGWIPVEEKGIWVLDSVIMQHCFYYHCPAIWYDFFPSSFPFIVSLSFRSYFSLNSFSLFLWLYLPFMNVTVPSSTVCPQTINEIAHPNVCACSGNKEGWVKYVCRLPTR